MSSNVKSRSTATSSLLSSSNSDSSWTKETPKPLLYDLHPILEWLPNTSPSSSSPSSSSSSSSHFACSPIPPFFASYPFPYSLQFQKCPWQVSWSEPTQLLAIATETHLEIYQPFASSNSIITNSTFSSHFIFPTPELNAFPHNSEVPSSNGIPRENFNHRMFDAETTWTLISQTLIPFVDPYPGWRTLTWSTDGDYVFLSSTPSYGSTSLHILVYSVQEGTWIWTWDLYEMLSTMSISPILSSLNSTTTTTTTTSTPSATTTSSSSSDFNPLLFLHVTPLTSISPSSPPGSPWYRCLYVTLQGNIGLLKLNCLQKECQMLHQETSRSWFHWISHCVWIPKTSTLLLTGPFTPQSSFSPPTSSSSSNSTISTTITSETPASSSSSSSSLFPFLAFSITDLIQFHPNCPVPPMNSSIPTHPISPTSSNLSSSWLRSQLTSLWTQYLRPRLFNTPLVSLDRVYLQGSLSPSQHRLLVIEGVSNLHVFHPSTFTRLETFSFNELDFNTKQETVYQAHWWSDTSIMLISQLSHWYLYSYPEFQPLLSSSCSSSFSSSLSSSTTSSSPSSSSTLPSSPSFYIPIPVTWTWVHPSSHALILAYHPVPSSDSRASFSATSPRLSRSLIPSPPRSLSFLTRTLTSLMNTFLWHFEDSETVPSIFPLPSSTNASVSSSSSAIMSTKITKGMTTVSRKFQLWQWHLQYPETLLLKYLTHHHFDTALSLAYEYGLNTDLIYQTQWKLTLDQWMEEKNVYETKTENEPSKEDITKEDLEKVIGFTLLDRIQNKLWILDTCLHCCISRGPLTLTFQFIHYGVELAERLFDSKEPATYEFLKYQCELLQLKQRCQLFQLLYSARLVEWEMLESFRETNLVASACQLASQQHWKALELLFDQASHVFGPFRCFILYHIPTFVDPNVYASLLPTAISDGPSSNSISSSSKIIQTIDTLLSLCQPYLHLIDFQPDVQQFSTEINMDPIQWYRDRALKIDQETGNAQASFILLKLGQSKGFEFPSHLVESFHVYITFLYQVIPRHHPSCLSLDMSKFNHLSLDQQLSWLLQLFSSTSTSTPSSSLVQYAVLPLLSSEEDWKRMFQLFQSWTTTTSSSTSASASSSTSSLCISASTPILLSSLFHFLNAVAPYVPSDLLVEQSLSLLYKISIEFPLNIFDLLQTFVDQLCSHSSYLDKFRKELEQLYAHTLALEVLFHAEISMNYATLMTLDPLQFLHTWLSKLNKGASDVFAPCIQLFEVHFFPSTITSKVWLTIYTHLLRLEAFEEASLVLSQLSEFPSDVFHVSFEYIDETVERHTYALAFQCLNLLSSSAFSSSNVFHAPDIQAYQDRIQVFQLCYEQVQLDLPIHVSNLELFHMAIPKLNEAQARKIGTLLRLDSLNIEIGLIKHTSNPLRSIELCQSLILNHATEANQPIIAETLLQVLESRSSSSSLMEFLPFCFRHLPPTELPRILDLMPIHPNPATTQTNSSLSSSFSMPTFVPKKLIAPFFDPSASKESIDTWLSTPTFRSAEPLALLHGTSDLHTALSVLLSCDPLDIDIQFQSLQLYVYVLEHYQTALGTLPPFPSTLQNLAQLQASGSFPLKLQRLVKEVQDLEHQSIHLILNQVPDLDLDRFLDNVNYQEETLLNLLQFENQLDLAQRVLPCTHLEFKDTALLLILWIQSHSQNSLMELPRLVKEWVQSVRNEGTLERKQAVVRKIQALFENEAAKQNQAVFYNLLSQLDSPSFESEYHLREDLAKAILEPSWSCQSLILQFFQGNRDFFAALFKTYFNKYDPKTGWSLFPKFNHFFQRLTSLTPIPTFESVSVIQPLPFGSFQSLWVSSALIKALKSRSSAELIFQLLLDGLTFVESMEMDRIQSELLNFLKKHLRFSIHSSYSSILPLLPMPFFQSIKDALLIFKLIPCEWIQTSVYQYPLSTFLFHGLASSNLDQLDAIQRLITWDATPLNEAIPTAVNQLSVSQLLSLLPHFFSSAPPLYHKFLLDRCVHLNVESIPFPDIETQFQWQSRTCVPNVFLLNLSLDELHKIWLRQSSSIHDHEVRTYSVFQNLPFSSYSTLWKRELAWLEQQDCEWLLHCLLQWGPSLTQETELNLFSWLTSPTHIFTLCICAHHSDLTCFAQAMLTPLPNSDPTISPPSTNLFYSSTAFTMILQSHPSLSTSPLVPSDFFFTKGLGLHPSLWSHWIAQRIHWSFDYEQAQKTWLFHIEDDYKWWLVHRRFQS